MSAKSEQITVRLDGELAEQFDCVRQSVPYDVSKSEIVRTALREHFDQQTCK